MHVLGCSIPSFALDNRRETRCLEARPAKNHLGSDRLTGQEITSGFKKVVHYTLSAVNYQESGKAGGLH